MNDGKEHGIVSNIVYALKNIWRWDRRFYLYFIPSVPIGIALPLGALYFSKVILDSVQADINPYKLLLIIFGYFLLVFLIDSINKFFDSKLGMRQYNISILYQQLITEKHMKTDYSNTDNPAVP